MKARDYLESISDIDASIQRKAEEIQRLYDQATRITSMYKSDGGSGGGGVSDKIGDNVTKIVALAEGLNNEISASIDRKAEALALLGEMKEKYATVLHRKYIMNETFEEVANSMNYTLRNVGYLHGDALNEFQKVLDRHLKN